MDHQKMCERLEECLMVDTLELRVPNADVSRLKNKFVKLGGDDGKRWATGSLTTKAGKKSLEVRGIKSKREFYITGSPAFHHQDHNVVSSGDVTMLAFSAVQAANEGLKLDIKTGAAAEFAKGIGMQVTRIDTPVMTRLPDGISMKPAINGLALAGLLAGINISVYQGETVYFDQHSQSDSLKAYSKAAEMQNKRKLSVPETCNTDMLRELTKANIRLEAVYRQKYLKYRFGDDNPRHPALFTRPELAEMFMGQLEKYDLKRDLRRPLNEEQLMAVHRRYRMTVLLWQHGYDVLSHLGGNRTEHSRCRTYLLTKHGIDIYGPPPCEMPERVEVGEILSPANFVPVPDELRADPTLFFEQDMEEIRRDLADWQSWQLSA